MKIFTRKNISFALKICIVFAGIIGVFISLFTTKLDGYSHWFTRFLYFTTQSNLWIGFTALALLLLPYFPDKNKEKWGKRLHVLQYVFTVSITVTGLVFCFLLAPFADESYRPWSFTSILTHVVAPLASIVDFFVDTTQIEWKKHKLFYPIIPPLCYFAFAMILGGFGVDFGRGEPFPYFFLNFKTEAGLFGFVDGELPQFGSMYWILLILFMILGLNALYSLKYKNKKIVK